MQRMAPRFETFPMPLPLTDDVPDVLEPRAKEPLLYIDYLVTAPWNIPASRRNHNMRALAVYSSLRRSPKAVREVGKGG